jgi:hypothetical protein
MGPEASCARKTLNWKIKQAQLTAGPRELRDLLLFPESGGAP